MKTYIITFTKNGTLTARQQVEAANLATAINKAVRQVEQIKKNLDKKGYDYAHLCGIKFAGGWLA